MIPAGGTHPYTVAAVVLMLARCELRRRWRSALALVMLVGIIGGVILASAAGAHRSATALNRFITYSRSSSAEVDVTDPTAAQLRAFRRNPDVADMAVLHAYALTPHGAPNLKNAATIDGRLGTVLDRARLVAGREANLHAVDEVAIGQGLAQQLHLGIGDHIEADSITRAQLALANENKNPGPPAGPVVRLRVVGIVRRPLDLGDLAAAGGVVIETPAFDRAYRSRIAVFTTVVRVVTRDGAADVPAVAAAARRVFGPRLTGVRNVTAEAHGGEDAINVLTLALWIFAAVAAVAGAVAIAIVLSRDISQAEYDQETLASLGLTRRERAATVGGRVLLIALGGTIVAAILAIALSPLFPIGIARRAEPTPGVHVDGLVLGVGVVALATFVGLIGALTALRATRLPSNAAVSRARRARRTFSDRAAEAGLRPTFTNGLRMALEPGRGRNSLPVRSAFFGAVLGVIGLSAALVFGASLGHLDATPKAYGWTWDFKAPDDTFTLKCGTSDYGLGAQRGVAAVAAVCYQPVELDGRPTTGWSFTQIRGSIEPEVVSGRAASGPREVALGAATLHALGKKIGDTVRARGPKGTTSYTIVGQVVLPEMKAGDEQPLAEGAAFTPGGYAPLFDQDNTSRYLLGTFASGSDHAAVLRRVDAMTAFHPPSGEEAFVGDQGVAAAMRPPEVDRLRNIGWFPPLLAGLVVVLALVAIGHTLMTTTRRRRSELAVLKALGFERRQVRATLAWQATTLATVGLIVGIPIGVVIGSVVWRQVAENLGISPAPHYPTLALVLAIPVVIAVVNIVGFCPARSAARSSPAVALTVE